MVPSQVLVCLLFHVLIGDALKSRRLYMFDGIYQSAICFFMPYLMFAPATFVTSNGRDLNDNKRMGVYTANATIIVVNVYILMNTLRWDWLMVLIVMISILLIFFWTGVWTSSHSSTQFYKAGAEVYGQLTFWTLSLLTVSICLLPRFALKAIQKIYLPTDVDIIREQVSQGKFKFLDDYEGEVPRGKLPSATSSDLSQPAMKSAGRKAPLEDDERPMYPPSVAATGTTHNPRSQNGSDGTDYTGHRKSLEPPLEAPLEEPPRPSMDRPRPSFDRMRDSMDRIRPSYEASNDFTSAALLTRMESSHSDVPQKRMPHGSSSLR